MKDLNILARQLDQAAVQAKAIPQLSQEAGFDLEEAYEIQKLAAERRYIRGERPVGIKMGFTSRAKMLQMGINEMIWGRLTDGMVVPEGGSIKLTNYIHPRIEPELCFLTRRTIDRPLNALEAVRYVEAIAPALEIIDSRYENFKFTLEDVVADNSSSSGLVIGPWSSKYRDFSNLGLVMEFNGRAIQIGSTAAILGHPLRAFTAATELLYKYGGTLPAGSLIMAGGATAAEYLQPGLWVQLRMEGMGVVGLHVGDKE